MNLAALWQVPVLFCCENNYYAMGTELAHEQAETDMTEKAASYRIPALAVDGMDVLACRAAALEGAYHVRNGGGPFFLEFRTYRFRPHSMFDPEFVPQQRGSRARQGAGIRSARSPRGA